jgi:hypothetical protein
VEVVFDDWRHATGIKSFLQAKKTESAGAAGEELPATLTRETAVPHNSQAWGKWLASAKHKWQLINIINEVLSEVVAPLLRDGRFWWQGALMEAGSRRRELV